MKNWTTQAEQRLEEYLQERVAREGFEGEDAVELKGDLKRHIHEEAERSAAGEIGLLHLENLLGRLDAGYRPIIENQVKPRRGRGWSFWCWTFGLVFPAAVLLLEVTTSMCGEVLFNPVPTWWHVAWIAMVPFLNAWLLCGGAADDGRKTGAAAGFSVVTAGFYGLMFLPLIHMSVIGLIFIGFGLLPLTPVMAGIFSWLIGRRRRRESLEPGRFKVGWMAGALAALAVLVALEAPALWTRANLANALEGGKSSEAAIGRLRAYHSERTLLKACYEGNRGINMATDISGWVFNLAPNPLMFMGGGGGPRSLDSDVVRDVFFRVTGKPWSAMG
jgi:hypothetical protein